MNSPSPNPPQADPFDAIRGGVLAEKREAEEKAKAAAKEKDDKERDAIEVARAWWNLGLFFIAAALWILWYARHVEPLASRLLSTVVIGAWTIPALYALVISLWQMGAPAKVAPEDTRGVLRIILRHEASWYALLGVIGLLLVLNLITSSIYVTLNPEKHSSAEVEIFAKGTPPVSLGKFAVTKSQPTQGGPAFFRSTDVEAKVNDPTTHRHAAKKEPLSIYPWTALRLTFPDDFEIVPHHVVRLIPDAVIQMRLPATMESGYLLEVKGLEAVPFNFQCYYLATSQDEVSLARAVEGSDGRLKAIKEKRGADDKNEDLAGPGITIVVPDLAPGKTIEYRFYAEGVENTPFKKFTVPQDSIHNVLIDSK